MTLPPPPYVVKSVDSPVEQDHHGNSGAFITLQDGTECLLRLKGPFPIVGDTITDRVLEQATSKAGNTYLKLVKPSRNGSQGRSQGASQDGPDEAYWAGQNAAKGRAHAQEMSLRLLSLIYGNERPQTKEAVETAKTQLLAFSDFFEKDVHAARDRAVAAHGESSQTRAVAETSPPPGGSSSHDSNGIASAPAAASPQPSGISTSSDRSPTEKQTETLLKMARERGLDGAGMKRYLKAYCRVEQFSQLPKNGCIDQWAEALKKPDPGMTDIPVDDAWPPEDLPAPAENDDSLPF